MLRRQGQSSVFFRSPQAGPAQGRTRAEQLAAKRYQAFSMLARSVESDEAKVVKEVMNFFSWTDEAKARAYLRAELNPTTTEFSAAFCYLEEHNREAANSIVANTLYQYLGNHPHAAIAASTAPSPTTTRMLLSSN